MYLFTVWLTIAVAAWAFVSAYHRYKDVFHPLIFTMPMFVFIYGYMPLKQVASFQLFSFLSEDQVLFFQVLVLAVLGAFIYGCLRGSSAEVSSANTAATYDPGVLQRTALVMGGAGMLAWAYMVHASGGLRGAFGAANGGVWSDIGYIRDSVYLLLLAIFLLLSKQLYSPRSKVWWASIVVFAFPWLIQALLGARRGPTFVLFVSISVSWYMARNRRPPFLATVVAGALVGFLMLFLVANRGKIFIGSQQELSVDNVDADTTSGAANEYIFGAGCVTAARQSGEYFWGKRILAYVLVRPIPHQLWPNKYEDFGVPELLDNAGVAKGGLQALGWVQIPGAAAAMVGDFWVELWWGAVPLAGLCGWAYGYCWSRAIVVGGVWNIQYVILVALSVYLVTQGIEAVEFRLLILSIPTWWVWRKAVIHAVEPVFA